MMIYRFLPILFLSMAAGLSACGFKPMYDPALGSSGASVSAFHNIRVELDDQLDLTNRDGAFHVQQALIDRIGTQGQSQVLTIRPRFLRAGYGVSSRDVASRYNMNVSVQYTLMDAASGKVLTSGTVSSSTTFGAPTDPYGRISAEQDATQNVARAAADRILIRLGRYYAEAQPDADEMVQAETPGAGR